MKDGNAALLSNYEVYKLLTDLKQQCKGPGKSKQSVGQQNLNTITYETLKYISKTPCKFQSPEIVRDFLIALKNHKLTKLWKKVKRGLQKSKLNPFSRQSPACFLETQKKRKSSNPWLWKRRGARHRRSINDLNCRRPPSPF
uniref:DNA-directed RNA polymerase III subunit RPC9 n=1 Tax=Naja naja TaxID=35670 RepID=A0A8C7E3Y7_NAJNA